MFGSENYTQPVQLDPHAFARHAVSAAVNDRGMSKIVKLTQGEQTVILTRAEIAALAEMVA